MSVAVRVCFAFAAYWGNSPAMCQVSAQVIDAVRIGRFSTSALTAGDRTHARGFVASPAWLAPRSIQFHEERSRSERARAILLAQNIDLYRRGERATSGSTATPNNKNSRALATQKTLSQWFPPAGGEYLYSGFKIIADSMYPYSLSSLDGNVVAFEVRPGDVLNNPATGYRDPSTSERSEISMPSNRWTNGTAVNTSYEFLISGGFDFNTNWVVVGQMHADLNTSPPFEFAFRNGYALNRLLIVTRAGAAATNGVEKVTPVGGSTIARDVWHKVRMETMMGQNGYQRVWFNDQQVLNLAGSIGFNEQKNWYWRMGIYRRAATATYRIQYRNFVMSGGSTASTAPTTPSR